MATDDPPPTIKCFSVDQDTDRDGYARVGAVSEVFEVGVDKGAEKLTCPAEYVPAAGDCNDHNATIHPYRVEVPFNGKDDNCNGERDESTYLYSSRGFENTDRSFKIKVKINNFWVILNQNYLYAKVRYVKLRDTILDETESSVYSEGSWTKVRVYRKSRYDYRVDLKVLGLESGELYRAQVKFARKVTYVNPQYDRITREVYTPITDFGETYYYTLTKSNSLKSSSEREKILLHGFTEYSYQEKGYIGQNGKLYLNGTRYYADKDEYWCTEFYAWLLDKGLPGVDARAITWIPNLVDFFGENYHEVSSPADLDGAKYGDFISMYGAGHTTMFLVPTRRPNEYWMLEGNNGNRVKITNVPFYDSQGDQRIDGYGHITKKEVLGK